jgi:D-proline reductase (dithiol) PrdB
MGCARDIVEYAGVARFLFSDFPLGNSCGKPNDVPMQRALTGMALNLLDSAASPRTTVQTPFRWATNAAWKRDFYRLDLTPEQITRAKEEFDMVKTILKVKLDGSARD